MHGASGAPAAPISCAERVSHLDRPRLFLLIPELLVLISPGRSPSKPGDGHSFGGPLLAPDRPALPFGCPTLSDSSEVVPPDLTSSSELGSALLLPQPAPIPDLVISRHGNGPLGLCNLARHLSHLKGIAAR